MEPTTAIFFWGCIIVGRMQAKDGETLWAIFSFVMATAFAVIGVLESLST